MTEIALYLKPVEPFDHIASPNSAYRRLGEAITIYTDVNQFPSLDGIAIAIIGVDEDRNSVNNEGCGMAPDSIRNFLYNLYPGNYNLKILDLGNIIRGNQPEDTYFALTSVVETLLGNGTIPLIIGGGQDLAYAAYKAYQNRNQIINIAAVDNQFDLGETEGRLTSQSYLSHIILHKPNYLFNYTNIGYQTFLVNQGAIDLMKDLFFDVYRLGIARSNMAEIEPLVRNADMLAFDISAIRQSDAPGNGNATPNGFYGEEACQITRYAGMSDKLTCIGFYEMNPAYDRNGQTAHQVAQMIWYFIDGFYHRQQDHPGTDQEGFIRYNVQLTNHEEGIVFFKSKKTERWWMEVKCAENIREKYRRHYLVPCSYADYQTTCENDIPDRWWQAYQKLM